MKTILLLLLAAVFLPALAQVPPPKPPPPPPPPRPARAVDAEKYPSDRVKDAVRPDGDIDLIELPKATVRGRVFYDETGQPLRRTWVGFVKISELVSDPTDEKTTLSFWEYSNAESVLTNDFGEFVMTDVEPGVYQAVLKLPGILNPTSTDRESSLFRQYTFESGSDTQIEVGVKRGGAVSGFVRYSDGAPLIGAFVSLLKPKRSESGENDAEEIEGLGVSTTDDRGYYRFAGLPEGEYVVRTSEPSVFDGSNSKVSSYVTTRYFATSELKTFFPNAKTVAEASRLQVFRGEELTDVDITLAQRELYEVSGLVVDTKTNRLVDGIEIEFSPAGAEDEQDYQTKTIRTTTTDTNGRWKFKDMVPGKYIANISESSYRRYREEGEAAPTRPNFATTEREFEVTVGENRDVIFRIAVEASIAGVVSVEGNQLLPDTVNIYADTKTERVSSDSLETMDYDADEARQKSRSEFRVDDLKPGEYFVTVKASEGYFAKSITYQGKNVMDSPIAIKEGQDIKDIRVILSKGSGTVEGEIVGAEAGSYLYVYLMPVREGVSLYRSYLQSESDYAGGEGTFEIQAKPGEYYIFIKEDSEDVPKRNATEEELEIWVRELLKNARRINLSRGQTLKVDLSVSK